ncbi:conjugal transfer protein TraG N-terminal domain-containing protein [Rubrimonas cliftonensis]|uniref:TraG-like protein, N-terminal region n=1 Tax=Rubrimonas cliftonensis TaxID=89524 RepID=A0A1H4EQ67_9RHOB|nr:conjugal transfer protein TraG N-terminal domain-containing protein [Rubrimonas cliftonensis]SEA86670.1 TraG-like protein, N-terminal region [Rubrimonas cliftonensis]
MQWFVFGDLLFLADIVNGVAAMTATVGSANVDDYTGIVKIAAIIGVAVMFIQGMSSGGMLPISRFLMVPIFFAMMMVPKVTVTMENVYSGVTRTIANVPYGIALAGQTFSFIGLRLTELAETAYTYPGVTNDGLTQALDNWRTLRLVAGDASYYGAANNAGGGDFARSWVNYISTCTAFGLDVGNLTSTGINRDNLVTSGVYNPSRSFGAEVYVGGGLASNLDCVDAHAQLMIYSRLTFLPALKNSVLAQHFYDPVRDAVSAGPGTPSWALVEPKLTSMFNVFGGLGAISLDDALLSMFVGSIYDHGRMRRLQLDRKDAYAIMTGDGIRARNAQWMAQGDIFQQYVKPLLSFIEGFWYATFPLVVIALLLGAQGLMVMIRFLQIGLWIQLWGPCIAIVNLFVHHTMVGELSNLDQAALTLTSLAGQFAADSVIQNYLGVAGLFASAVPALALLLVTGSMYTFNGVAASVGGPDTISEGNAAPARQALSPKIQVLPEMEVSPMHGLMQTGAAQQMPRINLSQMAENRLSSADTELGGRRVSFAQSIDKALTRTTGSSSESFSGSLWRDGTSAQMSDVYQHANNEAFRTIMRDMQSNGMTANEAATFTATVGASVAAGRGAPKISGDFASSSTKGISEQKLQEWGNDIARAYSEDKSLSAGLTTAFSRDSDRGFRQSGYSSNALTSSQSVREEAQDYAAAEWRFEQANSFAGSVGVSANPDVAMLARRIVDDPSRYLAFARMIGQQDLVRPATERAQELHAWGWSRATRDSERMALAAGGLLALADAKRYDHLAAAIAPDGFTTPIVGDFDRHQGASDALGAGPSVDLSGARAGGFNPDVAPDWSPESVNANNREAVRERVDEKIRPIVQDRLAEDRGAAEGARDDALTNPGVGARVGSAIASMADGAADIGLGAVRRQFLAGFETDAMNAGLAPAEAQYYAFMRATPNVDGPEQTAQYEALRGAVEERYAAVPDAGAAQIAEIEEAARAAGVRNTQLLGSVAERGERVAPDADDADLDMMQRNMR